MYFYITVNTLKLSSKKTSKKNEVKLQKGIQKRGDPRAETANEDELVIVKGKPPPNCALLT